MPPEQQVIDLSVRLLLARVGGAFGRGFRLKAIGRRLYVQLSGAKAPLYLDYDALPGDVLTRAQDLRGFLDARQWRFDAEAWREACAMSRVKKGKPQERRLSLDDVIEKWCRLKRAEGVSQSTIDTAYLWHLRRLDPRDPLGTESLLRVIEHTDPHSVSRRRVVPLLRRLCAVCGAPWDAALLDPLQNSGKATRHRPQPFFLDEEIEAMLSSDAIPHRRWRRVVALMAIYGLRPWEAWIAEPCNLNPSCVWIGRGKVNPHGPTAPRRVPPFHRHWLDTFQMDELWEASPPPLADIGRAGQMANQALRRCKVLKPGGPTSYGFRHSYARRLHSPQYRVIDTHAALFLGHTVAVHHQTYRSWLGGEDPVGLYLDRPG